MQRLVIAGALASLVAWAGAPAQAGQTTEGKGKTVTLTGCLAKGDTPDTFMLNNASRAGDKAGAAAAEKSTAKDAQGNSYHLSPGKTEKMEAHVGHTVQITGTLAAMPQDKSAKSSGSSGAAGTAGSASKTKAGMQHVTVTGMKHVSGTCS